MRKEQTNDKFLLPRTLFRVQYQLEDTLNMAIKIMTTPDNGLEVDKDGYYNLDSLCAKIKEALPSLGYLNKNHIVELFFKDKSRRILINDVDGIKYKEIRYVQPPDTLYFGTFDYLAGRMKSNGIRSSTKGYVKLYETPKEAMEFTARFKSDNQTIVSLKIDAKGAFTSGTKFSTYKVGEYIAVKIDEKFIQEVVR